MGKCTCHKTPCCCNTSVITKRAFKGDKGDTGRAGTPIFTVKDNVTTVTNVREMRFTDSNAVVTNLGGGVVQINFTPQATVWNDILNIPWYSGVGVNSFKPQYSIDGNRISFRGLLYIPLTPSGAGSGLDVTAANSYLNQTGSGITESRLSIITNANNNNGTRQGRFMTSDVVTSKNLPSPAIPQGRDITFSNVFAYRRYTALGHVTIYRSMVTLIIGSTATAWANTTNTGSGCVMVFSPFQDEYDGSGNAPLGNDPLALLISNATNAVASNDYVGMTDNNPFTVSAGANNPFTTNAHTITSLGGYIINLEGLSGYIN